MKRSACFEIQVGGLFLGLGMVCLVAGCATPKGPAMDPQIKVTAEAAQAAFQRGEVARADVLYGKALARARLSDNRDEIVRNAYNLALCKMIAGRLDEARRLLEQAALLTNGRGVVPARILLAEAEVARLAGDPSRSEQLARQAMETGADRDGQVQAWLLQGEAWIRIGKVQSALDCFKSASRKICRDTPATVRARLAGLESDLVQAGELTGSVAMLQLDRADWLKQASQFTGMVEALQAAAQALERDSKWAEAFDCRIRAAQSLLAAGDRQKARDEALKAEELAERTGSTGNRVMVSSLMGELK